MVDIIDQMYPYEITKYKKSRFVYNYNSTINSIDSYKHTRFFNCLTYHKRIKKFSFCNLEKQESTREIDIKIKMRIVYNEK